MRKYKPKTDAKVSATKAMLYSVRDELKSDIFSVRGDIKSIRGEIEKLRGDFQSMEGRLTAKIHRIGLLVEEQNARNAYVMDGLIILFESHKKTEARVTDLEKFRIVKK